MKKLATKNKFKPTKYLALKTTWLSNFAVNVCKQMLKFKTEILHLLYWNIFYKDSKLVTTYNCDLYNLTQTK